MQAGEDEILVPISGLDFLPRHVMWWAPLGGRGFLIEIYQSCTQPSAHEQARTELNSVARPDGPDGLEARLPCHSPPIVKLIYGWRAYGGCGKYACGDCFGRGICLASVCVWRVVPARLPMRTLSTNF